MKLWLLRPNENLKSNDNPWEPWYNKCHGFVIRAETEADARHIASQSNGDENEIENIEGKLVINRKAWSNPKYSTCVEISLKGEEIVIMEDYRNA